MIFDGEAPELRHVLVRDGFLEIQISEEPDLAAAGAAIQIDGASLAWTLAPDRYTLVSAEPLTPGSHDLTIGTGGLDLAGQGIAAPFSAAIGTQAVSGTSFVFREPDPRQVENSAVGNGLGFHGLGMDAAAGLIYVRNRWFDAELERFVTTDPLGFVDGPCPYAFAGNDPVNFADPAGLQTQPSWFPLKRRYQPRLFVRVDPVKSSVSWSDAEIEQQLNEADRIFKTQADVSVYWTEIKKDPDPKEVLTSQQAQNLLDVISDRYSTGTGGYAGVPIYYVRETTGKVLEGGSSLAPDYPSDRRRAAIVGRYWGGQQTNQYITAHELGHAIGGLCDSDFPRASRCGVGVPIPDYGGVMKYPDPYDKHLQGDRLNEREVERLRRYAKEIAETNPQRKRY